MKFFNVDGSIKRENETEEFGWVWKNLSEDRGLRMTIYNSDGSVKSVEYYDELKDWEIITDAEAKSPNQEKSAETVNSIKWYQRTLSSIQEGNKEKLTNLLIALDNKESHLILSIVNTIAFNSLKTTKLRKTEKRSKPLEYSEINNDVEKTLRLKKLHQTFNVDFDFELLRKRYGLPKGNKSAYEVNKYIEDYLEIVDGLKQILFWDVYPPPCNAEVNSGPESSEIDKNKEPNADIDQTLLKLFDKTCEMHCEVEKIRKCFLEYEHRIELVLKECKNIQEDIYETKYLNAVILSLNYKIENMNHDWPFKIGGIDKVNKNFIV